MLSVTSNIRTRLQSTIHYFKSLMQANDDLYASSHNPPNATAQTWERDAPICQKHGTPKFRSLVTTPTLQFGEYACSECKQEQAENELFQLHTGKIHALFPESGQLSRRIHLTEIRHHMQEDAVKSILASLTTDKDLSKAPEAAMLALPSPKRTPTEPLPARDIERASTVRADLFPADDVMLGMSMESDDGDTTARRPITHKPHSTVQIPAINAEVLLMALMAGPTHEQSTGENERLPVEQDASWLR